MQQQHLDLSLPVLLDDEFFFPPNCPQPIFYRLFLNEDERIGNFWPKKNIYKVAMEARSSCSDGLARSSMLQTEFWDICRIGQQENGSFRARVLPKFT